jgi:O-acetyl-ADP-ribose deacetylase (regulator of RNase III)
MIKEVSGDILHTGAQVIAHGVAANDPMSQGLALSLHERYPAMHKDYHHWCHLNSPEIGEAWMWGGAGGVRIVNLVTQEGGLERGSRPGSASIKSVRKSLRALAKMVAKEGFTSIALPRLATGVGGLDWADVKPLIYSELGDLDIDIYLYSTYVAGEKAAE